MEPDMLFLLHLYLRQGKEATISDPVKNCDYDPFKFNFRPFTSYQANRADMPYSCSYKPHSKQDVLKSAYGQPEKGSHQFNYNGVGKQQPPGFLDEFIDDYV